MDIGSRYIKQVSNMLIVAAQHLTKSVSSGVVQVKFEAAKFQPRTGKNGPRVRGLIAPFCAVVNSPITPAAKEYGRGDTDSIRRRRSLF